MLELASPTCMLLLVLLRVMNYPLRLAATAFAHLRKYTLTLYVEMGIYVPATSCE